MVAAAIDSSLLRTVNVPAEIIETFSVLPTTTGTSLVESSTGAMME